MSNNERKYFAAKLLSPRPTFPFDMTDDEKQIIVERAEQMIFFRYDF